MLDLLAEDPGQGATVLARRLGVKSRTTVYTYLDELEAAGRIRRNDRGAYEVINTTGV